MSALVTSEIFRPFVNTLTPNDKYSRRYMQKKEWLFFDFLLHFSNVREI